MKLTTKISALALVATLAGCANSRREAVIPTVAGNANGLQVDFNPKHPWIKQNLLSDVKLIGTYNDGRVRAGSYAGEVLADARRVSATTFEFEWPEHLKAVPTGKICLKIHATVARRDLMAIPVRIADGTEADTTDFRFPAWERIVKAATQDHIGQSEIESKKLQIQQLNQNILAIERKLLAQYKGSSQAHCDAAKSSLDRSYIEKDELIEKKQDRESEAKSICVGKIQEAYADWNKQIELAKGTIDPGKKALAILNWKNRKSVFILPNFLEYSDIERTLRTPIDPHFTKSRSESFAAFKADWDAFNKATHRTELVRRSSATGIPLIDTAATAQHQLLNWAFLPSIGLKPWVIENKNNTFAYISDKPTQVNVQGWIGANLDAYAQCKTDVARQLEVAWMAYQRTKNWQDIAFRTKVIRERCTKDVQSIASMKAEYSSLQQEISSAEKISSTDAKRNIGTTQLNEMRCQ